MNKTQHAQDIIATLQALVEQSLNIGMSGNVSCRYEEGMLISPSGMSHTKMHSDDIVHLHFAGGYTGKRKPSSESPLHQTIYQAFTHIDAVVHTHSPYATALACRGQHIPAFHYMVAVAGGSDIPCTPYALFGTETLAQYTIEALRNRKACLLGNHGVLAMGKSLQAAFNLALEVENLAKQYTTALSIGKPNILSEDEMAAVLKAFGNYGQRI